MTSSDVKHILLIGYGNPGRCDDGLGPALVAQFEAQPLEGLAVDSDYQLTVENAYDIAKYDVVIFADAAVMGREPFFLKRIYAQEPLSFSTHSVAPEAVLYLAESLFQANTAAYLLGIRGYQFNEFSTQLSEQAKISLNAAYAFIVTSIQEGVFRVTY